jgi:hypothetical protein
MNNKNNRINKALAIICVAINVMTQQKLNNGHKKFNNIISKRMKEKK